MSNVCLRSISEKFNLQCVGDIEVAVTGIAPSELASETDIAFCKESNAINSCLARVVLCKPCLIVTDKILLFTCDDVEETAIEICNYMVAQGVMPCMETSKFTFTDDFYYVGKNVVVGKNSFIAPDVIICDDVVIGDNCKIGAGSFLGNGTKLGNDVCIGPGSRIGVDSFYTAGEDEKTLFFGLGRVLIHEGVKIGANTVIQRGTWYNTVIGRNTFIDDMVTIGHDVFIENDCIIISQVGIAGGARICSGSKIYGQSGINNNVTIGKRVVVKSRTGVTKDVNAGSVISGEYGRDARAELKLRSKSESFFSKEGK